MPASISTGPCSCGSADYTLWAMGSNANGQLGLGDNTDRSAFEQVGTDLWKMIACGLTHTIAIKSDGTLWATGGNLYGQLGLGDNIDRNSFVQVGADTWIYIAAGQGFTIAIRSDGSLWGCGRNYAGQLGLGDNADRNLLTHVDDGPWASVSVSHGEMWGSYSYFIATKPDGTLWGAGFYGAGNFGIPPGGFPWTYTIIQISTERWLSVSCGVDITFAIKEDGTLWGTGYNQYGNLGIGDYSSRESFTLINSSQWAHISAGAQSFGIKTNGDVYASGLVYNDAGPLLSFTKIGTDNWESASSSLSIRADGTIYKYNQVSSFDSIFEQLGTNNNWVEASDFHADSFYIALQIPPP